MGASQQIKDYIAGIGDWRGEQLARVRELTLSAVPDMIEEWKWNSPVWSKDGMAVSAGAFKNHVSISFFQGASLPDPQGLFEAGQEAKAMRSIKLLKGDGLNEAAYQELVRAAVAHNAGK